MTSVGTENGTNRYFFLIFISVNFESSKLCWSRATIISTWSPFTESFPYTETRPVDKEYRLSSFILNGFLISNQLKNCWNDHSHDCAFSFSYQYLDPWNQYNTRKFDHRFMNNSVVTDTHNPEIPNIFFKASSPCKTTSTF